MNWKFEFIRLLLWKIWDGEDKWMNCVILLTIFLVSKWRRLRTWFGHEIFKRTEFLGVASTHILHVLVDEIEILS